MWKMILVVLLFAVGCGELTPEQRQIWSSAFRDVAEHQERQLDRMYYSRPGVYVTPPRPQSNYWQEERARQQYWDSQYKKWGIPRY